jgi:excisionase family DNA binding protein
MSRVLTVKEVADYLHVCPATIYRLLKRDGIPAFRLGGTWGFDLDAIERWTRGEAG